MAFDQNSIPKDLRPLNIPRTLPEEPRVAVAAANNNTVPATTTTTAIRNPEFFTGPEGSVPVFYPATVADAGFVGLGYGNPPPGFAQWSPVLPVPAGSVNVGLNSSAAGFGYGPNLGSRVVGNAVDNAGNDLISGYGSNPNSGNRVNDNGSNELTSVVLGYNPGLGNYGSGSGADHGSEEGGDDSVSGKKVKFLCSFGGKIMPRPSDSMLRYVGGQTRIISVRRDVSFSDLVQKMVDTYGQPVVIKYQLPDEDLDALVSVSCPDDLENMMEEYEKLVERSSDGSAKLRVFLFSATEVDGSCLLQFGDLQESGQKYVDAVNGITDGIGGLIRKESITSATSTQNSDFSGTEAVDIINPIQGDVTGPASTNMLSPVGNLGTSHDSTPKLVSGDPTRPVYADASAVSLGIPVVKSGPPPTLPSQSEVEIERSVPVPVPQQQLGYDFQQTGIGIPSSAPNLQAFVDQRQEIKNHADYMHLPLQMGFPSNQLRGAAGSVLTQQQIHNNNIGVVPHQFIPAVQMTMVPSSSHAAMRPTVVQPLMQALQSRLEQYPENSQFGTRIVQLPVDPSYHAYQGQLPPGIVGGGYSWCQVPQSESLVLPDGSVPYQQVISRLDDCYMCQKALPHAHSDPLVPDQRESSASSASDSNSVHHSLRLEDTTRAWPMNRVITTGAVREGNIEHGTVPRPTVVSHVDHQVGMPHSEGIVFSQNLEALQDGERIALQKVDNSDQPKVSVAHGLMGFPGDLQSPYGVFTNTIPQSHQEDSLQHHLLPNQYQVKQDAMLSKPIKSDSPPVSGVPLPVSEGLVHDPPKEYSGQLPRIVSNEDVRNPRMLYDQLTPIDGMAETLRIYPPQVNVNNEAKKSPVDKLRKEDISDHRNQQMAGGEVLLDNSFHKPRVVLDSNQVKQSRVLPASTEVSYVHSSQPMESYEVAQPMLGNPTSNPLSNIGIHLLDSGEVSFGNPAISGVKPAYIIDEIPPVSEWTNDASQLQSKIFPDDSIGNMPATISPALTRVANVQDSSNSLFSNQDPWSLRHDTPFPPRPTKIAIRKETFGARDPFIENQELIKDVVLEDAVSQPLGYSNTNLSSEHHQTSKGSSEDLIKQELKAVAEGVAASVFKSATTSPDSMVLEGSEYAYEANQDSEVSNKDVEMQHKAVFEDMKSKMPEKLNFGFPVSEGIGRLQIIKNSDLEELRELGSGTFGTVYHGKWRGTDVAIKRINDRCFAGKPSEQERMIYDFWNEAINLADLHHPNVVAFYGVVLDGPGRSVATVTEYMVNGSLRNALQKNERGLDKRKRLLIAMDVAFGMEYLHGKNIVHFDLKSDNLLVNLRDPHRPICKVGDLGLSKVKCQTLISGGVRGTLPWMAPELLNGSSSLVSEKVDVFSFGIVMWELVTGEEPYADLHYGAIIGGIVSNTLRPPIPESCDLEWKSLMVRCWSSEPSERPSFTEIVNVLRAMAAKIPPKGQNTAQQVPSTQVQK